MFKIENEKELIALLKIISEEAVSHTKKKLAEDSFDSNYQSLRKKEKNMFEQEGDEEDEIPEKEVEAEEDYQSQDNKQKEPERPSEEGFVGSMDRLVDFVNDIRSAPSLKDSAVDEQVSAYYDRLSEEERNVLVFFLRELSRVMTGKASGEEARDPSDPPLNIEFIAGEKTQEKQQDLAPEPEEPESVEAEETPESTQDPEGEEDTSPPIRVNENQDHDKLRKKIRKLFI